MKYRDRNEIIAQILETANGNREQTEEIQKGLANGISAGGNHT